MCISRQGIQWMSDMPVLGNLFSSTSTDKEKDNLLIFLTPHVVRNKTDLRYLALDQRSRFANTLGQREMHDMPSSSIRSLYGPTFSVAVPPAADLNMQNNNSVPAPGAVSEGDKPTPVNTGAIPASSSSGAPSVAPRVPVAAAGPVAPSAATATSAPPALACVDPTAASPGAVSAAPPRSSLMTSLVRSRGVRWELLTDDMHCISSVA